MAIYKVGTLSVSNGSDVVTGVGTSWLDHVNVNVGDLLLLNAWYEITAIDSNTRLRIAALPNGGNYSGNTLSGSGYVIISTGTESAVALYNRLGSHIASWQEFMAAQLDWLGGDAGAEGAGPVTYPLPDSLGNVQQVESPASRERRLNELMIQKSGEIDAIKSGITIIATDGYRQAVEHNSGGKNTVIYDAQGNPNIMCVIPRFNVEDLGLPDLQLGTGTHPAFVTNGVPRGEILVGKYLASTASGGTAVIGGAQPRVFVNYDAAKGFCTQKGSGWHLMSVHEWAAIALWSLANNTVPRGNTNYGRSHEVKWEVARRADGGMPGDTAGAPATDTGSGPATWSHDHTEFGVHDLVGNVWEWIDQLMLNDGQVIATSDNQPTLAEGDWSAHAAFFDSPSSNQVGTGSNGSPILSDAIINMCGPAGDDSHSYPYLTNSHFAAITKSGGYVPNELLRRLLIESASTVTVGGAIYARNYGLRFPLRGGRWHSVSGAGLGALYLGIARSYSISDVGFRPAFFV